MTAPGDKRLTVLIDRLRAGVVTEDRDGRLELTYDDSWRNDRTATPLSLSMPLADLNHGDAVIRAYLWGLLPDNEQVLDRWARRYQVSARNPFRLLRHVGEDCAGAAQFVRNDRVEALIAGGTPRHGTLPRLASSVWPGRRRRRHCSTTRRANGGAFHGAPCRPPTS